MVETALSIPKSEAQIGAVVPEFEITDTLLQEARQYVMDSLRDFESQRIDWRDMKRKEDRAYRCMLEEDRAYEGFDDKAAPIVHDNIEAIVARIKESIIPTDQDIVELEAEGAPPDLVKFRSKELNTQLEKQDIENKVESFARTVAKFGTAYIFCGMIKNERTIMTQQIITEMIPVVDENGPVIDPNTGQPMVEPSKSIQMKPELDRKYFGPGYDVIQDSEDVYVDMFIENIQDQPIVIRKVYPTWEHLMEGVKNGIYFEEQVAKIKDSGVTAPNMGTSTRRAEDINGTSGNMRKNKKDGKPKLYEMYQAHADFAIERENPETGEKEEVVYPVIISVIANECVQLMPNPYFHQMKPLIKGVYRRVEGEAYGLSAIYPVMDMYHEYNDTANQVNDGKMLKLNGIVIQKAGSIADQQDCNVAPGERWTEKNTGDIRPFIIDFPMAEGMQYIELLEQRINRGMGITPLMMGQGDATDLDKTWRGTNKLIQQADKKFKLISKGLEDACIRGWAELAYKENCQFNPLVDNTGQAFKEINSEVGFKINGVSSFFEKQEKMMKYSNFAMQTAQIPGMNIIGLALTVAEFEGIKIDEQKYGPLYTPPPPPPPEEKPLTSSVTIPLDPSKGRFMALAAAQVLAERGIVLDVDAIGEANKIITNTMPEKEKVEGGTMPPQKDSYSKGDKRSAKQPSKKS